MKIKYNIDSMKFISLFETLTRARVKDYLVVEGISVFVVNENDIGLAIGKNGINAKKAGDAIKKPVKIVAYSEDVCQFVKNYIYPVKVKEVTKEDNVVTIEGIDTKSKGIIIGRDRKNLNNLIDVTKRYFDIEKIQVI